MDETSIICSAGPAAEGRRTLTVTGEATIAQAAAFKDALVGALADAREVHVDFSAATEIDVTALQLLCAAHQSAAASGKALMIVDSNSMLKTVADAAGFQRHVGCAKECMSDCIWGGKEQQ